MSDFFTMSLTIAAFALLISYIQRRNIDKCLVDFSGDPVSIHFIDGDIRSGVFHVESTGFEISYVEKGQSSYSDIFYKQEYPLIQFLIRHHEKLDALSQNKRLEEIQKIYHPNFIRTTKRKVMNIFKTARDAIVEIFSLFVGQVQKKSSVGKLVAGHEQRTKKLGEEVLKTAGAAYEPLLERHIGNKMIAVVEDGTDKTKMYKGVLKEYTSEHIELLDVVELIAEKPAQLRADIILRRDKCVIRHLGEAKP